MNTSPLTPPGSLETQPPRKTRLPLVLFGIIAAHVIALGILLIQGCKREEPQPIKTDLPPLPPPWVDTNPPPPPPPPPVTTSLPPATAAVTTPPSVPPAVLPEPTAAPTEHVIAKGETLGELARKYGVSLKAILQANPGVDPNRLKIGQKINIPPKPPAGAAPAAGTPSTAVEAGPGETIYTVKKGDTLTKIAREHQTTVKALRAANNLRTDQIKPDQKLKIPAKAPAPAPAPAPTPAPAPAPLTPPPAPVTPPPAGPAAPSLP